MATAVSANDKRHASSLIVALEFYPQMAIKMIHKFPPNIVLEMIQNDPNNKFMKSLNASEKKLIPTLSTDGFNKLDISLLYRLIRRFNLLPEPSKEWGNRPLATNINQEDDMERMRLNRNDLVHRPRGGLSEEERDKFFKESMEIARRVDKFIGDSTSSFETEIRNAKIHSITQEQYRQALEKCAKLQQQLTDISGITSVDLYYGDDIAVKLGHATDYTRCTIYIRNPNMNVLAIIEQLKKTIKILNEGSYDVILLDAKSGSLVLHVEIHNHCFITKDSLHKAIAEFLHRVFTSTSGSLYQNIMEVVLAECDSYIISDNEEKNDEYLNVQEPSILKLDVMVRNTSLQSETDLYRDVHGFISKVPVVTDKDVESKNGSPLAVIMTSQHVDDSSPSGTPENNKIDPDQLKLIKEDEGNKILGNEAKEFTKEGAQVDSLVIKEEEQDVKTATIEFRKMKLEEEGLHFRGSIPDDGNSFFEACSDQLQRLEISGHTHTELRQMVIKNLKLCSENEIKSANFTSDTWEVYIDNVAKNKGNVEDIVVETMAKLLQKQIIVYSKSYKNEISRKNFNEEANGEPILLAKDNLYYQSLERRHDITPSRLQESNTSMYSPEFIETLSSYEETVGLADLEEKLISSLASGDSWREGKEKTSFNYLFLDPRVTKNLPSRMDSLGKEESFKVFVAAIFYVGKGQGSQAFIHFHEAIRQMQKRKTQIDLERPFSAGPRHVLKKLEAKDEEVVIADPAEGNTEGQKVDDKVKRILDIWNAGVGVVYLHCFQNAIPVEAYTRKACMIDAIMSVDKLTNRRKGTYYGISETWSEEKKKNMGFYFLKKAHEIFKEEGEKPLFPVDIKGGR